DLSGHLCVGAGREGGDLLVAGLDELELVAHLVEGTEQAVNPVTGVAVDALDAPLGEAIEDELGGVGHKSISFAVLALVIGLPERSSRKPAGPRGCLPANKSKVMSGG